MSPATNQCKIKRMVSAFASFFVLCSRTRITSQGKLLSILATTAKTSATFTLCTLMPRPASFLKMGAGGGGGGIWMWCHSWGRSPERNPLCLPFKVSCRWRHRCAASRWTDSNRRTLKFRGGAEGQTKLVHLEVRFLLFWTPCLYAMQSIFRPGTIRKPSSTRLRNAPVKS